MPKFLGNRIGYGTSTSSDGGLFNLHSQQIFLKLLSKWPPFLGISSSGTTRTDVSATKQRYHVFTSPGSFTVTSGGYLHYTIVAGGGGGGHGESRYDSTAGGGGGGGGFRSGTAFFGEGTYTATVGAGGLGGVNPPSTTIATSGGPSSISGPSDFATIESAGGGYGGSYYPKRNGSDGGSGGGGAGPGLNAQWGKGGEGNTPAVTPPQGNPGGIGGPSGNAYGGSGGGGGGAGGSGESGKPDADIAGEGRRTGGNGGSGREWGVIAEDTQSGLNIGILAGGGGGGGGYKSAYITYNPNAGLGTHGGGHGGSGLKLIPGSSPADYGENGYDASANTGGGGGGGSAGTLGSYDPDFDGGDGGSGIIIISHTYY
jgi:hypothetical protein